ncbi:hypothetical protein DL96DRAFT_1822183 [Flagelloscypha sp. PMI_526]|nr:hypothetical protein DL96DRAFT_1822183 [Flagelloscypha sp. PMI_526]
MTCPQNAGLPTEIWLSIISLLTTDEVIRLQHLNAAFWNAALNMKYSTFEITLLHPKGIIKLLRFYSEPFVAPRVKCVSVDRQLTHSTPKRAKWLPILDSLILLLQNVVELVLYPVHRDKVTRRLLGLLVQSAPRLDTLSLDLREDFVWSSPGMAREFFRKRLSLPALRELNVIYHPYTRYAWQPTIRRMISESQMLEKLQIYHSTWPNYFLTDRDNMVSVIPAPLPPVHPHLRFVRLAGREILQDPGVTQFLQEYRSQLRALDVGYITSQIVGCIAHFTVLSSLWVRTPSDILYFGLVDALSGMLSLREFYVRPDTVDFSARNPSATFPPIPDLPFLEKISIETIGFDLPDLRRFSTTFPNLRCMTVRLMSTRSTSRPCLTCGSQTELSYKFLYTSPYYCLEQPELFRETLLKIEPMSVLWRLDQLCIRLGSFDLTGDVVTVFLCLFPV